MLVLLLLAQIASGPNLMRQPPGLTTNTAAELEQTLAAEPENLDARMRLTRYYFLQAMAPQRAAHIFWMIEHHPESSLHTQMRLFLRPRNDVINTPALYEQGRLLWGKAVERHPDNGPVLINAAQYLFTHDPFESEKLLLRARAIAAAKDGATNVLVGFYSYATNSELGVGVAAVSDSTAPSIAFRDHVRSLLLSTNDALFPGRVGLELSRPVSFPPDSPPPDEYIAFRARANEYGRQLLQRAQTLEPENPEWRVVADVMPTVAPIYPPQATQARIQGLVRFIGLVGPEGTLTNLTLVGGHPLLVASAQEAARQSRYPDRIGQTVFIDVPFRLP